MSQTPISNQSSAVELGRLLAEKRNQKGMSLEDAAARLKLAPEKVRALEKGDYKGLPELVYVRGFLRNYARLVGMDVAELNRHLESATPVAKQDMSVLEQGPHQKELAHLENRKKLFRLDRRCAGIGSGGRWYLCVAEQIDCPAGAQ